MESRLLSVDLYAFVCDPGEGISNIYSFIQIFAFKSGRETQKAALLELLMIFNKCLNSNDTHEEVHGAPVRAHYSLDCSYWFLRFLSIIL